MVALVVGVSPSVLPGRGSWWMPAWNKLIAKVPACSTGKGQTFVFLVWGSTGSPDAQGGRGMEHPSPLEGDSVETTAHDLLSLLKL